jgi:hypothetical protein
LGGSHRYKHLYEFSSYNFAEKILFEHLFNVSKDIKKEAILDEQAKKIDMNVIQTNTSKEMREEIERQRQIMTNASAILKEDAGIRNPEPVVEELNEEKKPLNELSIDDDEQILTDDGEDIIALDDELDTDVVGDDVALDQQDVQLDQQLVDMIPELLAKMDDLNDQLQRLNDEDDFDVEEMDDEDVEIEIDMEEGVVSESNSDGGMSTIASQVTADSETFDYEYAGEDPRGRNEIPSYNKDTGNGIDGDIGPQNMHKDTLDQVKGKGDNTWNPSTEKIDVSNVGDKLGEGKQFYVVERDGTVHGYMTESDFKSMLNGKKVGCAKGGATPSVSNPFDEKVKHLTDNIFRECVEAGIFKIKK